MGDKDQVRACVDSVDSEAVQENDDAGCYPWKVYEPLWRFTCMANKPFAKNNKEACL